MGYANKCFSYYNKTDGLLSKSDDLFEFLVSELIELLDSTDKQDVLSLVLEDLENFTISENVKQNIMANYSLFKEFPGLAGEFLAQNIKKNS